MLRTASLEESPAERHAVKPDTYRSLVSSVLRNGTLNGALNSAARREGEETRTSGERGWR